MAENQGNNDKGKEGDGGKGEDEPYLGTWKTKEDAAEGLKNLQTKLSEQGSDAGVLRQQLEEGQTLMGQMQEELNGIKSAKNTETSDRESETIASEQAKIAKQIADLDPVDEGYSKNLMSLMQKSNTIAAKTQQEATLMAATEAFKNELDERDVKSAHQAFFGANPEFNTPEMQARIKEYIAKDSTGMSDPLVAFREIQRDDMTVQAKELSDQNTELQKLLELKKGTSETGTVIKDGQGGRLDQKTNQPKVTGAERNKGMADILAGMKQ